MGKNEKPLIFFGGCNCGNGKHLRFCRASNSQRRGRGFESLLLHQARVSQLFSTTVPAVISALTHVKVGFKVTQRSRWRHFLGPGGRRARNAETSSSKAPLNVQFPSLFRQAEAFLLASQFSFS